MKHVYPACIAMPAWPPLPSPPQPQLNLLKPPYRRKNQQGNRESRFEFDFELRGASARLQPPTLTTTTKANSRPNYLAMSGADNLPVGRDHLQYLELQRAQAAAIAATADLSSSDIAATAAAVSPNFNSNDFSSTFSALPPRTAMNRLIMNYLVTGEKNKKESKCLDS